MLRNQFVSALVMLVIAGVLIDVIVIQLFLRSASSFTGTNMKDRDENDKLLKLSTNSNISNWYPRMQSEIKENKKKECVRLIQNRIHEHVTEKLLKDILKICFLSGIMENPILFNISFIKQYVQNFSCPTAQFLTTPRPLVALASYPGSGNTWTRELIETLTGTLTGSIYTDWNFKGSDVCPSSGNVYIVKTHTTSNDTTSHTKCIEIGVSRLNYTKAVLILRNPYQALLAEFNRQQSPRHSLGIAYKSDFKTSRWETFVKAESEAWKKMAIYWLTEYKNPVYILFYDDLWNYTAIEMYKLSRFFNITTQLRSFYCISGKSVGNFKRRKPKWMIIEKLFDNRLKNVVNSKIRSVIGVYKSPQLYSYIL